MTKALTRLAVENREILERLDANDAPRSVEAFARLFNRDPSNFRKTLRGLEAEGWIRLELDGRELKAELTADGAQGLAGMRLAEGRLRAGLPTLTHAQIVPDPNQPRRHFEQAELEELADSLAERGQLQPILVRMIAADQAMIVAGERRWRAIGLLIERGDQRWPADRPIAYHLGSRVDEAEILIDQVVENLQRAGLHELEEALAFAELKAKGWGVGQISKTVGKTRKFVETRLDLLLLPKAQQDRMRLPKDDPQRLTFSRAREMVQELRRIAGQADEQRDIEEIAPANSVEQDDEARKVKLTPQALMVLGEIAAATMANPSAKFPDSPVPVADVASFKALASERTFVELTQGKRWLIETLIDKDQAGEPAGVRLTPLGHARLRLDKRHPGDDQRALYHLRRDAGISADQARQLTREGRYATAWLNAVADREITPGGIKLLPHELLAAVELADRTIRGDRRDPGNAAYLVIERAYQATAVAALGRAKIAVTLATPIEPKPLQRTSIALTKPGADWLKALDLWPEGEAREAVLERARIAAGVVQELGEGEYGTAWLGRPTAEEQAQDARYREHLEGLAASKAPRADVEPPPAQPAQEAGADPELQISEPQLRILRELARAQRLNHGNPVRVGAHWLDLDAVELAKRAEPLIEFKAAPAEGWRGRVTSAGHKAIEQLAPGQEISLDMRIDRNGAYDTAWLNPDPAPIGEQLGDADPADAGDDQVEPAEAEDARILRLVREGLAAGAPFAELLQLAGLVGPFEPNDDWSQVRDAAGNEAATVDPWRSMTEGVATARLELVAFALNTLSNPES